MFPINFLNHRQIGLKANAFVKAPYLPLNLDHLISRFVCLKRDIFTVLGEENEVPPFACKFRKDSFYDLLAVAAEDGVITLYNTRTNAAKKTVHSFSAHHNAIWDIAWLPDKCQLITGSGDLSACLFDMNNYEKISTFKRHTESVKSVDVCHEQSAIFATGSRDGCIYVWDTRDRSCVLHGKPSIGICQAHCRNVPVVGKKQGSKGSISSVSAVAFQDSNNLASAGVIDGIVKIWDLRKTYVPNPKFLPLPKHKLDYAMSKSYGLGCTSLVFDSLFKNLYACTTGNKVFRFNCHLYNTNDVSVYEGFSCATYFVKAALSNNDQYLLCGSSDYKAYLWKTSKPGQPMVQLPGHDAEVTAVAWSPNDVTKFVTCGDDDRVAVWKIGNTEGYEESEIFSKAEAYSGPKCSSPCHVSSDQSLSSISVPLGRTSPQSVQTPRKAVPCIITNFFSPVAHSPPPDELSFKDPLPENKNVNISENIANTPQRPADSSVTSPSHILTPCNHSNSSQSPSNISICDSKTSTPNSLTSLDTDKENSEVEVSPETSKPRNSRGQTKRKRSSSASNTSAKKSSLSTSSRSKAPSQKDNKHSSWAGKTIMNYFAVLSPPNN